MGLSGSDVVLIWVVLLVMVSVLMVLVVFAWKRKRNGKILVIERDFRNPYKGSRKYLLLYDKRVNGLRLYSNVFKPRSEKLFPTFEREPFLWDKKVIYAYQGISGNPDDDNIVPVHKPLVSQAAALQQSKEISNSLINTMNFLEACKDYRVEQRATYTVNDAKEQRDVPGVIKSIGYAGVEFEYSYQDPKKENSIETRRIIFNELEQLKNLKPFLADGKPELMDKSPAPSYEDFITPQWVLNNFGIVPVEDVNVMLAKQKDAIASFNSSVNDRVMSHASWLTRNSASVMIIMLIFVVSLSTGILYYQWSQAMAIAVAATHGTAVAAVHPVSILPNVTS